MGVRRFINLLVANRSRDIYSLSRFDLSGDQFFYPTPEEAASHGRVLPIEKDAGANAVSYLLKKASGDAKSKKLPKQLAASEIGAVRLPAPLFNIRPAPCPSTAKRHGLPLKLDAFPLSEESKVLFADSETRVLSYDADSRCLVTMPSLHSPKNNPLAISIPGPGGGEGSLYIIERLLRPEKGCSQFEALISGKHGNECYPWRTWRCQALPPPPLERDTKHVFVCSSAVVGDFICVSLSGIGTYCFDTVSHSWSRAGDWMLPFAAEYVPELSLWFGVSGHNYLFPCAADLSPVLRGQPPEPALVWGDHLPEELHPTPLSPSKMVSLGSGRICLLRFLETKIPSLDIDEVDVGKEYAVFTGLEVVTGNWKRSRVRMIRHKTKRCRNLTANFIQCLF